MRRNVEIFIQEGIVIQEATLPSQKEHDHGYGWIEVKDPRKPEDLKAHMTVFTMLDHSFEKDKPQPPQGSKVYFFMVPMQYIVDDDHLPGDEPFLAVNVTNQIPFLAGDGLVNRHPCTTVTTIQPDKI